MRRFKGIVALDIDGTLTTFRDHLPDEVNAFLNQVIEEEWIVLFITGRTFSFAEPMIAGLKGTFYMAVQNGAALYSLPSKVQLAKHYLSRSCIPALDPFFEGRSFGLLIESGREAEDRCYYCPDAFSAEEKAYLQLRRKMSKEAWIPLAGFSELPLTEFAVGKFFAKREEAEELSTLLEQQHPVRSIVIRDPFREGYCLAHINAKGASKGAILSQFHTQYAPHMPILAAGDDWNDKEMLERSTYKIVMQNAPQEMHSLADYLAPPAKEQGIIPALREGMRQLQGARDLPP